MLYKLMLISSDLFDDVIKNGVGGDDLQLLFSSLLLFEEQPAARIRINAAAMANVCFHFMFASPLYFAVIIEALPVSS